MDLNSFARLFKCYDDYYLKLLQLENEEEIDPETFGKLRDVFEVIFKSEENIENSKYHLDNISENDVANAFQILDYDGNGEVDIDDMKIAMKRIGILCTERDVISLIHRYSNKQADSFILSEFTSQIIRNL